MLSASQKYWRRIAVALVLVAGLLMPTTTPLAQSGGNPQVIPPNAKSNDDDGEDQDPQVVPPNARPYGLTYAQWSAKFSQWGLALPVQGHPFLGCPDPPDAGQSGPVWFLAGGPAYCALTVPAGKAFFFPLVSAECSSLEDPPFHGDTAKEQRTCAKFWADHIVVASLFCEIDGVPVKHLASYRFVSPQYEFTAPTPWVFGNVGGTGTSVSDGYFLMLHPLSKGVHTIHFGGTIHLSVADGDPFDGDFGFDTTHVLTVGR